LPLYNWDHFEAAFATGDVPGLSSIPFACFESNSDIASFYTDFLTMNCEISLDWSHPFYFNVNPNPLLPSTTFPTFDVDPRAAFLSASACLRINPFVWKYEITNFSLLVDWIKPSSDITSKVITAFGSPTGIPYEYTRVIRHVRPIQSPLVGMQQVVLPFSFRSLPLILVALKDPIFTQYGPGNTIMYLPTESSFQ